jgi:hypothetical protein
MKLKPSAILIFAMVLGASSATQAATEAEAWSGAYGQAGLLGWASYIPRSSNGTTTIPSAPYAGTYATAFTGNHASGLAGNLAAGYNLALNPHWLLGLGAALYPGTSHSATTTANSVLGTVTGVYDVSNIYSFSILPAYALDSNHLVYAKVGYSGATVHSSSAAGLGAGYPQQTSHLHGVVYGLGYKQIYTGSVYLFAEGNVAVQNDQAVTVVTTGGFVVNSTAKAVGYDVLLGLGYRF